MITSPSTWKAFIASHPSNEETNKSFPFIYEAFDKEKSIAECTNAALGLAPGIFMAFPIEAQKPILIHNLNKAFRNPAIRNDVEEFFGLISWDDRALAVKLDPSNLFALAGDGTIDEEGNLKNYFNDVDINQLFAARDSRAFSSVAEMENQDERMYLRRCVPVPPFIALILMDYIEDEDAFKLGARLSTELEAIRQNVNHDLHEAVTSDQGKLALKNILAWLLKAQTCFDLRIMSNQVFAGSKIDKIAKAIKSEKLATTSIINNSDRTTGGRDDETRDLLLQSNVAIMQELLENRRTAQDPTSSTNEKGFQKLSSAIQAFLLAIGSKDLEHPLESISKTGLELLKMTQKHAADELARRLRKERKEEINIEMANMVEIITIKWFASHNPFIGLSLCRLPPASRFSAASAFEKAEKLELQKELEIEKKAIMSTLTDRSLYRPITVDDLMSNVSIIQGIVELYVGDESVLAQRIAEFYYEIRRSKSTIKLALASDESILTKIQYVFDTRLNAWLDSMYENAENLLEVDHNLINFESIIKSIVYGTFATELPPNLLPNIPDRKRPADTPEEEKQQQKQKKGSTNNNIIPEFKLKEGETWSKFTKDPNNLRPSSVCMMFHILGHCPQGAKCKRAKSHEELTEAQKQQTAAFIEDCRK